MSHSCMQRRPQTCKCEVWWMSCTFLSFLTAEFVLNLFRKEFLKDVDAKAVVGELRQKGIVPQGCQEKVSKTDGYRQRNEILHDCLKRTCTREALMTACDIIIELAGEEGGEESSPKMKKVAENMKMKLETGKNLCVCWSPFVCAPCTSSCTLHNY